MNWRFWRCNKRITGKYRCDRLRWPKHQQHRLRLGAGMIWVGPDREPWVEKMQERLLDWVIWASEKCEESLGAEHRLTKFFQRWADNLIYNLYESDR